VVTDHRKDTLSSNNVLEYDEMKDSHFSNANVLSRLMNLKSDINSQASKLTENQKLMVCALISRNPHAAEMSRLFIADALGFFQYPKFDSPVLKVVADIGAIENTASCDRGELRDKFYFLRLTGQIDDLTVSANFIGNMFVKICASDSTELI